MVAQTRLYPCTHSKALGDGMSTISTSMSTSMSQWHKLTDISGGRGVQSEWKNFPAELLTITNETSSSVPCDDSSGCYMNVVHHGLDDIVGICTSDTNRCNRRKLNKSDIAIYRIDYQKLASKVSEAIGFVEQIEKIRGQTGLWKFGVWNPKAEYSFPVYCFLGQTTSQLERVTNQLCMKHDIPFLLIASVSSLISNVCYEFIKRHRSKLIGLDDVLRIDAEGKVHPTDSAGNIIENCLGAVIPKSSKPGSEYRFPTPSGATWEQFVFEFTAREMLLVTCRHVRERLEPEHMKMKDQRSGRSTHQWTLLLSLATNRGSLSWKDTTAGYRINKQKQSLVQKLQETFSLSSDPVPWSRREKCYKSRFVIRAADNVIRQMY